MAIDIRKLRQQTVFNPPSSEDDYGQSIGPPMAMEAPLGTGLSQIANQQNSPVTSPEETELQKLMKAVNQGYTPETGARDRYNQLLDAFPQRQAPSFGRALVAAGLSIGSKDPVKTSHEVMDAPNIRAMEDWKTKTEPFSKAAQEENTRNINERALVGNVIGAQSQANRIASQERIASEKNRVNEMRARAYAWKQEHPNWDWDTTGPTYVLKNPQTGEIKNTGIKTGELGAEDLQLLKNKGSLAAAQATAGGALNRELVNPNSILQDEKGNRFRIDPTDPTKIVPVTGGTAAPLAKPGAGPGKGQPANLQAIQDKAQETLDALHEIYDEKKSALKPTMTSAVGASRIAGLQYLPASETRAADAAIKRLKNMLTLELLGEMKAQSRTGATGFGQLSIRELGVLESAASKLDPTLDEETFTTELKRIEERLKKIVQPGDGLSTTTTTVPKKELTADELILKYSKPAPKSSTKPKGS